MTNIYPDTFSVREEAARALGLDPRTIAWPGDDEEPTETGPVSRCLKLDHLGDHEWAQIRNAGILPDEPRQAGMTQRALLDAVLTVVGRGRTWTELDGVGMSSEAVRKKFARLARKGVWQALALTADNLDISPARRSILKTIGHRAQHMVRP